MQLQLFDEQARLSPKIAHKRISVSGSWAQDLIACEIISEKNNLGVPHT